MSFQLKSGFLPVTALKFTKFGKEKLLLAGCGPWLKIFSTDPRVLLAQVEALPSKRIHGIALETKEEDLFVLVFGQKCFRWMRFNGPGMKLTDMSGIFNQVDWIFDIKCLGFENLNTFKVAIAVAHNGVVIFDSETSTQVLVTSKINCLLYSTHIRSSHTNELVIASGTVFNDILLWSINLSRTTGINILCNDTSLTLKGHEGVIFCVSFDKTLTRLASVSDDRSVRLWSLPSQWHEMRNVILDSSLVLYGHTARIWKVLWLREEYVFTVGEDATCRVWDPPNCSCKSVITGHKGRNIWSMALDEDDMTVFTGGEDCSIRIIKISDSVIKGRENIQVELFLDEDITPRGLVLWSNLLLCLSNKGTIHKIDISSLSNNWKLLHHDHKYLGYGVIALANSLPLIALGNIEGMVKLLSLPLSHAVHEWDCHKGKIFSLVWIGRLPADSDCKELLMSCGPNGHMVSWSVYYNGPAATIVVEPLLNLFLPPSRHPWITSAILFPLSSEISLIICGDRKGSIHAYRFNESEGHPADQLKPSQSFLGIHGPNGVTHLTCSGNSIYSVGRDGCCRRYDIDGTLSLVEVDKFHPISGVNWIDSINFTSELGLLTVGFHGSEFILHSSDVNGHVFTFNCGGGHRSYALTSTSTIAKTGMLSLAYIKGSSAYVVQENVSNQLFKPVILEPFVGRDAVCMSLLTFPSFDNATLAVGSEDCSIVLLSVASCQDGTLSLKVIGHLNEHISSVQSLSSSRSIRDQSMLLFSGGGRASLKSWIISTVKTTLGCSASLQCEYNLHHLPSRPQRRKKIMSSIPPECRVTTLATFPLTDLFIDDIRLVGLVCVIAGCSDSIIRLYIYDEGKKCFNPLESVDHHRHCILVVKHLILPGGLHMKKTALMVSAATDGLVVFWDITLTLENWIHQRLSTDEGGPDTRPSLEILSKPEPASLLLSVTAHQSGVNDVSLRLLDSDSFPDSFPDSFRDCSLLLLASVGDDNALTLTLCSVSHDRHVILAKQTIVTGAHYSAITGVQFISSNYLLTSSIDQRVSLWHVSFAQQDFCFVKTTELVHNVVDPTSLIVYQMRDHYCVLICGIGMECIDLII